MSKFFAGGLLVLLAAFSSSRAEPIKVVAAENVYGDIAAQIGGSGVAVTSILKSPAQDPHEFEASAATARSIADARVVIYNGADYDPWAVKLLAASRSPSRLVIEVAKLVHKKSGDNPHLWYSPEAISEFGAAFASALAQVDLAHRDDYARRLAAFEVSMQTMRQRIAALRQKYAGTPITATEPLFDYMAAALGLAMRNGRFQLSVMNGTEPSAAAIGAFEKDQRTRAVKVLLYNTQTGAPIAERMRAIAGEAGIPVVAISETLPQEQRYQDWMSAQLDALERALEGAMK